ncbi:uncharacterized protein LOC132935323 isoform X2 [Metopolophium dirhodum]|uniref:uncharacterized protein LOC132935323 isoform X2 n=1 Tax=Metopolophium dirhodum TaxID=44670 RepID=UPI00298FB5D9|nr:uncharacterized protein LOC132935323 isoform X2 [Metopolophium dirhodum]
MTSLPDEGLNAIDPTPVSSTDEPLVEFVSFESDQLPQTKVDHNAYLFVVLCPPDGGPWALFTCILGFLALLICDGVCLSFILFDGRLGMVENLPPGTRTFEHLAVIYLFRYLTEPISCAFINRYGFRYFLFFGSILSVVWLASLCYIENPFTHGHYLLAIIGGIMCFTLVLWLFVSTPVTLKLDIADDETITDSTSPPRSRTDTMAWIIENFQENYKNLTIWDTIGNQKLFTSEFLAKRPIVVNERPVESVQRNLKYSNWVYEECKIRRLSNRNITNMFKNALIGSRPMYRDDILYDGNISLLMTHKKFSNKYIIEYNEYLMTMTRIYTIADVNEEKSNNFNWRCPIAISRVLKCMFNMTIWSNEQFLLMVASEALIHAGCLVPFMFIKGPVGQKTSAEAVITLIAGCFGLLYGRGLGYVLHGRSPYPVSLYHVGLALVANGLSLLLCATTTNDISNLLPYFGVFGITFGYYKSIQNVVLYTAFPLKNFNNVCGQISLVRGVSSFVGILFAVNMMQPRRDGRPVTSCEDVYVYAGILMMIASVCVTVLQQSATAIKPRSVYCEVSVPNHAVGEVIH